MWMNWCEHVAFVGHFPIQCKVVRRRRLLLFICMQIFTLTLRFKCITHKKINHSSWIVPERWTIPIIEEKTTTTKLEKKLLLFNTLLKWKTNNDALLLFHSIEVMQWQFQFKEMVGEKKQTTDTLILKPWETRF